MIPVLGRDVIMFPNKRTINVRQIGRHLLTAVYTILLVWILTW